MVFQPGKSGNPNGRPKVDARVTDLARSQTENAIATLVSIMEDKNAVAGARVGAATTILDRGWGKAPQRIEGDEDAPLHIITRLERLIVDPTNTNSKSVPTTSATE